DGRPVQQGPIDRLGGHLPGQGVQGALHDDGGVLVGHGRSPPKGARSAVINVHPPPLTGWDTIRLPFYPGRCPPAPPGFVSRPIEYPGPALSSSLTPVEVRKMCSLLTAPAPTRIGGQTPEVEGFCVRPRGTEEPCLNELLGTLAHELRSPLVTIVNAAEVIANGCDMEPPARRALAMMERQSRQALQIIDDLFDICAGTGGKLSRRQEVVG